MAEYYILSTKCSISERMTKKNGKVYDLAFRIVTLDGEQKQMLRRGFKTKTLAREYYTEFVTKHCELVRGGNPVKKDKSKSGMKVSDLIAEYLSTLFNQNKESTIYDKRKIFAIYILPHFNGMTTKDLTKQELYKWQDELWNMKNPRTNEHFAYNYLVKIRGHFNGFLNWVETRYEIKNVFAQVQKPKRRAPKTVMQIWTKEEFEKFIEVVDKPTYHALFTLMFYTGRRKGELLALSPDDIQGDTIHFAKSITRKTLTEASYKVTTTKADKIQDVPVCKAVQDELRVYPGGSPFLFGGNNPLGDNSITMAFQKYCKKAGVKIIRIHDLRHSFVSMLIHLGANFMVVAELIGDTVEQVTKTYAHIYESDKRAILERL